MNLVNQLKWRYATKKMDVSKKVSDADIAYIKEAIQLAASSFGLQPYTVLDIREPKLREQLKALAWNQTQITDASHLFVFCNKTAVTDADIDGFIKLKAQADGIDESLITGYGTFIKSTLKSRSEQDILTWTAKQTYIALGNALCACAEIKVDSTPMEGFDSAGFNKLLDLSSKGLNACVVLTIGYRDKEDATQHSKKARKPLSELFINL